MITAEKERQQSMDQTRQIFRYLPRLRILASGYWDKLDLLQVNSQENIEETEEKILKDVVIQMANILLDDPIFNKAVQKTNVNPLDEALMECLQMIDIIPDLREKGSDN